METKPKDTEKHEVKLTEKQLQIIQGIFQAKQSLEQEYNKVIQRESEFIVNLCEAKGIEAVQGIDFKDGVMYVPKPEPSYTEETKKKLKKAE